MSPRLLTVALIAALVAAVSPASAQPLRSLYLYTLADGAGTVPMRWPSLAWDAQGSELYAVDGNAGVVKVFNDAGMAIFSFGNDAAYGTPAYVAPAASGDVFVVSYRGSTWSLVRYSYRGEPLEAVELRGVPADLLEEFRPTALGYAAGSLFLADANAMRVLVVGEDGTFVRGHDLAVQLGRDLKQGGFRGFAVDGEGNLLLTFPAKFLVFVVTPDGDVRSFGTRGSTAGKFGVVSGITADAEGRIYVSDTLRRVVLVFDRDHQFIGEIVPDRAVSRLVAPFELAVGSNRVFVAQSVGGVKAFGVRFE